MRDAQFDVVPTGPQRHTATRDDVVNTIRLRFVFDDDIYGIEFEIPAGDRRFEIQRAVACIKVVVEEPRHRLGGEHLATVESVAHLDSDDLTVHDDRGLAQPVKTGCTIATNFVTHECLVCFGGEDRVAEILATILALDAVETTLVACEFGGREPGVVVTEQCIELITFEFHVQLALARSLESLFARVRVQRVVLVRVYDRSEPVAVCVPVAVGVVGQRQEKFALDLTFSEERDASFIVVAIFESGVPGRDCVVRKLIVAGCAFGKSDKDPVPGCGLQPGPDFLFAEIREFEIDRGFPCLGRGRQFEIGNAILAYAVGGLSWTKHYEVVLSRIVDIPL